MDRQRTFWDKQHAADMRQKQLGATDPNVVRSDLPRLAGQNAAILERLRRGPATNDELIRISRKYTSRISDLRKYGYTIDCVRGEGGLNTYVLREGHDATREDSIENT